MYKVRWNDARGKVCEQGFDTLDCAMKHSKMLGILVTIKSSEYEIIGLFGADSINQGLLPNGEKYNWYKRRKP
jgi:hypothetical protein